jgi:hypothetical protein
MDWPDRIGRRLKLRDVHILLAVVQWKSMARAAERLAISQPVFSKAIADLERTVGVRLLDRNRLGAEPTPYGLALLRHGLAAFDELKQGVKEIEPACRVVSCSAASAVVVDVMRARRLAWCGDDACTASVLILSAFARDDGDGHAGSNRSRRRIAAIVRCRRAPSA